MIKILAALFLLSISMCMSICVLMFGWGLEPKSWWWIIGGSLVGYGVAGLFKAALEKEETV